MLKGSPALVTSFVYLLPHKNESRFKIGKANDVLSRAAVFSDPLDLEKARMLHFPSEADACNAERMLHRMASRFHVKDLPETCGYTEWYDTACFEALIDTARTTMRDWLGLLDITLVPESQLTKLSDSSVRLGKSLKWYRDREITERNLLTGRWVSPDEQTSHCAELLKILFQEIVCSVDSNAYLQRSRTGRGLEIHLLACRTYEPIRRLIGPAHCIFVFSANPGQGPTSPMRFHHGFRPLWNKSKGHQIYTPLPQEVSFFSDLVEKTWGEMGLEFRPTTE